MIAFADRFAFVLLALSILVTCGPTTSTSSSGTRSPNAPESQSTISTEPFPAGAICSIYNLPSSSCVSLSSSGIGAISLEFKVTTRDQSLKVCGMTFSLYIFSVSSSVPDQRYGVSKPVWLFGKTVVLEVKLYDPVERLNPDWVYMVFEPIEVPEVPIWILGEVTVLLASPSQWMSITAIFFSKVRLTG